MNRRADPEWVIVGFLTLVNLGARVSVAAGAPFPINDGGLFYAFISDLLSNSLRLPEFSSYNAASIPFVYPPLAFFITAALHAALDIPVLELLQFAPATISAFTIPAFFDLAAVMLPSRRQALLATFVFSMIPRTFDWLIMGGGITRSIGLLCSLLFLGQVVRVFARGDKRAVVAAILFGGLLVLSHPEAAVHTAITSALLLAWHRRNGGNFARGFLVAGGIAVITAPWWLLVLTRHGLDPWLAAVTAAHQDTYNPLLGLVALFRFDFTDEPFLRLLGVLGLLGLLVQLAKREYFLATWLILLHLVEPRGGTLFMMLPLAMSAGVFLDAVLMPALKAGTGTSATSPLTGLPRGWAPMGLLVFLFLYGTVSAYFVGLRLREEASLTSRDITALEWIPAHTEPGDRFALVTGGEPLLDATSDWFPAITDRRSVASFFGAEWVRGLDFADGVDRYRALQACMNQKSQCIKEWTLSGSETVKYVYVRAKAADARTTLQESLQQDSDFQLVYSRNGVELFEWVVQPRP